MATPTDFLDPRYAGRESRELAVMRAVVLRDWWEAITGMAVPTPQEIMDRAACFACLAPGDLAVIQTVLMADILAALDGGADVTPQGILSRAACFACLPSGDLQVIQTVATAEAADAA